MSRRTPSRSTTSPRQSGAPVAKLRNEMPELVSGIGEGDRLGSVGEPLASEHIDVFGTGEPIRIEAEVTRQIAVQLHQSRRPNGCGRHACEKAARQACECVIEGQVNGHEKT